jgi:hypothetical protein
MPARFGGVSDPIPRGLGMSTRAWNFSGAPLPIPHSAAAMIELIFVH